jgi:seryl-tRNA synthetase
MLNAVSVGFIPLEWTETKDGYDVTKWELLEFSAVAVPSNQDAIAEAVKSFGLDESVVKDFLTTEKSGKRISAATKEILNKIKSCGDEIEKCRGTLKNIVKEMNELLTQLDDVEEDLGGEPEEKPAEKPEDDNKSFDLGSIRDEFNLSEITFDDMNKIG